MFTIAEERRTALLVTSDYVFSYNYIVKLWKGVFDFERPHLSKTIREPATIHHIASRLSQMFEEGNDALPILAYAIYGVINLHPFGDCNHRTGWSYFSTLVKLLLGLDTSKIFKEGEAEKFARSIDNMGLKDIEAYLTDKLGQTL